MSKFRWAGLIRTRRGKVVLTDVDAMQESPRRCEPLLLTLSPHHDRMPSWMARIIQRFVGLLANRRRDL